MLLSVMSLLQSRLGRGDHGNDDVVLNDLDIRDCCSRMHIYGNCESGPDKLGYCYSGSFV